MTFIGVNINKMDGGLGGGETSDRVAVLVLGGATIAGKIELYTPYELLQIEDAEDKGLTAEWDSVNKALSYYHLSEAFRLSPDTSIYLLVVPQATKVSELKNSSEFLTALRSIEGINTVAIGGLTSDTSIEVAAMGMQLLVEGLAADYIYIDSVLIEATGDYLKDNVADFDDLRAFDSDIVSPIWAQDPAVAARDAAYANHAAVGSALGMLMVRAVHENMGSVDIEQKPRSRKAEESYTLSDKKRGLWLSAALSNGKAFKSLSGADQKKLDKLGYIYVGSFSGYGGCYFSGSHTCSEETSDYCSIERNAVWNKAARIVRATLIPRIRSKVQSDPDTGYIKHTTVSDWDGRVRKALDQMVVAANIASFDIYIDPKQTAVSTKPFKVKMQLVADGIVHEFDVDLGYTKSI